MSSFTHLSESHVNATEGHFLCEDIVTPMSETYFDEDATPGDIFRHGLREFGRCTSSVYIDTADGIRRVGWTFEKREQYQDCDESYLHETWITLLCKVEDARPAVFDAVAV